MTTLERDHDQDPEVGEAPSIRAGRTARLRARVDLTSWGVGSLALVVSLGFLVLNAAYNQGRFLLPLDDVYIHLQYAKQIGLGHFLQYQDGMAPSTGASSLLYVLVLGAAFALGAQGGLLLYAAVGFGVVCMVATTVLALHLGRTVASPAVGAPPAAVLTALCGPLLWGATSGMEVGMVSVLAVGTVLAFVREQPLGRFPGHTAGGRPPRPGPAGGPRAGGCRARRHRGHAGAGPVGSGSSPRAPSWSPPPGARSRRWSPWVSGCSTCC